MVRLIRLGDDINLITGNSIRNLVHNLIHGSINTDEFKIKVEKTLKISLDKYNHLLFKLPPLRQALKDRTMTIAGIPPSPPDSVQRLQEADAEKRTDQPPKDTSSLQRLESSGQQQKQSVATTVEAITPDAAIESIIKMSSHETKSSAITKETPSGISLKKMRLEIEKLLKLKLKPSSAKSDTCHVASRHNPMPTLINMSKPFVFNKNDLKNMRIPRIPKVPSTDVKTSTVVKPEDVEMAEIVVEPKPETAAPEVVPQEPQNVSPELKVVPQEPQAMDVSEKEEPEPFERIHIPIDLLKDDEAYKINEKIVIEHCIRSYLKSAASGADPVIITTNEKIVSFKDEESYVKQQLFCMDLKRQMVVMKSQEQFPGPKVDVLLRREKTEGQEVQFCLTFVRYKDEKRFQVGMKLWIELDDFGFEAEIIYMDLEVVEDTGEEDEELVFHEGVYVSADESIIQKCPALSAPESPYVKVHVLGSFKPLWYQWTVLNNRSQMNPLFSEIVSPRMMCSPCGLEIDISEDAKKRLGSNDYYMNGITKAIDILLSPPEKNSNIAVFDVMKSGESMVLFTIEIIRHMVRHGQSVIHPVDSGRKLRFLLTSGAETKESEKGNLDKIARYLADYVKSSVHYVTDGQNEDMKYPKDADNHQSILEMIMEDKLAGDENEELKWYSDKHNFIRELEKIMTDSKMRPKFDDPNIEYYYEEYLNRAKTKSIKESRILMGNMENILSDPIIQSLLDEEPSVSQDLLYDVAIVHDASCLDERSLVSLLLFGVKKIILIGSTAAHPEPMTLMHRMVMMYEEQLASFTSESKSPVLSMRRPVLTPNLKHKNDKIWPHDNRGRRDHRPHHNYNPQRDQTNYSQRHTYQITPRRPINYRPGFNPNIQKPRFYGQHPTPNQSRFNQNQPRPTFNPMNNPMNSPRGRPDPRLLRSPAVATPPAVVNPRQMFAGNPSISTPVSPNPATGLKRPFVDLVTPTKSPPSALPPNTQSTPSSSVPRPAKVQKTSETGRKNLMLKE